MTELQTRLFNMLKWFTEYLEVNHYTYYIVGGTLLGAVRHKGFIPWDDDIDIAIPRPDYVRLMDEFSNDDNFYKLETPYENNPEFLYTYSKLYDVRTTLVERQRKPIKRGIYIDVFPLDGAGNNISEARALLKKIDKKNMFLMTRTCAVRSQRKWYKNVFIFLSRLLPFVNDKKYSLSLAELMSKTKYKDSSFVANFNGAYRGKELFNKQVFGTPSKYRFESISVFGPEKYAEYLTQLYGNWKELPPENKRGIQHDFAFLDLEKSYLEESDTK